MRSNIIDLSNTLQKQANKYDRNMFTVKCKF